MEDTEEEIDFANLIDMFDSSFYDEEDEENEIATLPKVKTIWKFITFCLIKINTDNRIIYDFSVDNYFIDHTSTRQETSNIPSQGERNEKWPSKK